MKMTCGDVVVAFSQGFAQVDVCKREKELKDGLQVKVMFGRAIVVSASCCARAHDIIWLLTEHFVLVTNSNIQWNRCMRSIVSSTVPSVCFTSYCSSTVCNVNLQRTLFLHPI